MSLYRLLADIARNPGIASRARHVSLWGDDPWLQAEAHANFDRFSGVRTQDQVDTRLVRQDIEILDMAGDAVRRHADEAIAHDAAQAVHAVPTYAQLNAAIDQIGELVQKYASLLKAEIIWQLEPVIQHDWKAPFRQPWIPAEAGD